MKVILAVLMVLAVFGQSLAQAYRPKAGETVLKVEVEGRGDLFIRLYTKEAPKTTAYVLGLVRQGYYDGLKFHRVERTPRPYLAQIGDPATRASSKQVVAQETKLGIENTGYSHEIGAVGLVRDRQDRDIASSQFYIMLAPAKFLDGNYTVFGQVVSGLEVLSKLEKNDRVIAVTVLNG
ncbi:MAG: peptidylprolyl isomerase [Fimbriimonas sp.]